MIDRAANEQTKGSDTMDWHGDLPRGLLDRVGGKPSCSSRYACRNNKAKWAESIEMAMHEKATRGDLPQRAEAAT